MTAEATARALLARATPRTFALPARGVEIAALDWGGDGPLALLHHANGFCKGVWGLVADALRTRWHVVAIDARGHGDSSKPDGPDAYLWDHFAEDVLAVAEQLSAQHDGRPIALGIGNSFGGTSLLGAAARHGELFERLLLVDPVIPPPPDPSPSAERLALFRRLVDGAQRRRSQWPSRAAAREYCTTRALFAGWLPAIEPSPSTACARAPTDRWSRAPVRWSGGVLRGSSIDVFARARAVSPRLFGRARRLSAAVV
jgi:pimeloyl-ACP methyl ester carboxylesterase